MNKERILALADLIEKQPHAGEDDASGFNMEDYTHSCGTPSCIAGWAACQAIGYVPRDVEEPARQYLNISYSDASVLFRPVFEGMNTHESMNKWPKITPQQAATTLRKLVETGKVDWSHAS